MHNFQLACNQLLNNDETDQKQINVAISSNLMGKTKRRNIKFSNKATHSLHFYCDHFHVIYEFGCHFVVKKIEINKNIVNIKCLRGNTKLGLIFTIKMIICHLISVNDYE